MKNEFTLKGHAGLLFTVYQTASGNWGWEDQRGYGFTNESLTYVLEYLKESCSATEIVS
jgi:hypothetical protein